MKRDVSLKVESFLTRATESRWMDGWVGGWTKNEYTKIDKRKPEQRGKRALRLEHLIAELEQRDKNIIEYVWLPTIWDSHRLILLVLILRHGNMGVSQKSGMDRSAVIRTMDR